MNFKRDQTEVLDATPSDQPKRMKDSPKRESNDKQKDELGVIPTRRDINHLG